MIYSQEIDENPLENLFTIIAIHNGIFLIGRQSVISYFLNILICLNYFKKKEDKNMPTFMPANLSKRSFN